MTPAVLADVVTFARESVGRADDAGRLARAVVALADERDEMKAIADAAERQVCECDCDCQWCKAVTRAVDRRFARKEAER